MKTLATFSEQYDEFINGLEEKGIPNPRVLVPLAGVLLAAVLVLVAFPDFLSQSLAGEQTVLLSVKDDSGKPIPAASVQLIAGEASVGTKSTDTQGQVTFKAPGGKSLQAKVSHENFDPFNGRVESGKTITLYAKTLLDSAKTLRFQIQDEEESPIDSASISVVFEDTTTRTTFSNEFGEGTINALAGQTATITVTKEGYQTKYKQFSSTDLESPITFSLQKKDTDETKDKVNAVVLVQDSEGNPIEGAQVTLTDPNTLNPLGTRTTDWTGKALFNGITAGIDLDVSASDPQNRYQTGTLSGAVITEDPIEITLQAKEPEQTGLNVQIRDESGNPVPYATVTAYSKVDHTFLNSVETDEEGNANLLIEDASAQITVYKEGFLPQRDRKSVV